MRQSRILRVIREGGVALICNPSFTYSWRVTEMVARMGFDGVWVDMEHRDFTYEEAAVMTLAARAADCDAVVRIRKDSYADFFRPLEDGAAGIMVPHIKTRPEAEFAVYNAKYAPVGRRGMDGVGADTFYGLHQDDHTEANRETFVLVQIEDFEGVDVIEEIVGVEGIDGILVGPADLSQSYGVTGQLRHEKVLAAQERVGRACREVGKWWGAPGLNPEHTRWLIERGAQFIALGSDYGLLFAGFAKIRDDFRELVAEMGR
jgi:2-dehydro-3-deoxyglucarate aldolase/4-hydroxy-2-oxoheptanedioate aldolase